MLKIVSYFEWQTLFPSSDPLFFIANIHLTHF